MLNKDIVYKNCNDRYVWLDITKALAIILMVLGHTSIPQVASNFIFAFHMPVFFLASGWCTNWEKYSFRAFLGRRCKTLLLPFAIYSLCVFGLSYLIGEENLFSLEKGWQGYALWFVPVLFFASLIAKLIAEIPNQYVRVAAVILCLIIGALLSYYKVSLPWTLSTVPYAVFLILVGTYLRKWEQFISTPRWYVLLGGFVIVAVVSQFWRLDLAWNNITPVVALTIGALSGAAMLTTISSYIEKGPKWISSTFLAIGKETFAIMAFSQIAIVALNKYFMLNPIVKYLLLAVILTIVVILKNVVTKAVRRAK